MLAHRAPARVLARPSASSPARRASSRALRATPTDGASTFSLLPANAADGLNRYRLVLGPLFALGGALHVPDLFGAGLIARACEATSFDGMPTFARGITALWALGGPATAAGMFAGARWADVGVVVIASTEIIAGVDFTAVIAPVEIPGPIVAAQCVNLAALIALRAWETAEARERDDVDQR